MRLAKTCHSEMYCLPFWEYAYRCSTAEWSIDEPVAWDTGRLRRGIPVLLCFGSKHITGGQ
jgi:hypothetical protein